MYRENDTCQIKDLHLLYDQYFKDKVGVYIDVGAFDPYIFSNTWSLAQAGWHGLLIEPLDNNVERLLSVNNATILNACVGDINGEVKLYLGEYPTIDTDTVEKNPWGFSYDPEKYIARKCFTLNYLIEIYAVPDVLSIDVEGAELLVLKGFTPDKWNVKMIIIETHAMHDDVRQRYHAEASDDWFSNTKYQRIYRDMINDIYILP